MLVDIVETEETNRTFLMFKGGLTVRRTCAGLCLQGQGTFRGG